MTTITMCPSWCTTDHDPAEPIHAYHEPSTFGGVAPIWQPLDPSVDDGRVWVGDVNLNHYGPVSCDQLTAPELRALAVDALAGAEWIEAHS